MKGRREDDKQGEGQNDKEGGGKDDKEGGGRDDKQDQMTFQDNGFLRVGMNKTLGTDEGVHKSRKRKGR